MKTMTKRIISMVMLVIMVIWTPTKTLAESPENNYIKEMKIFTQSDYDKLLNETAGGNQEKKDKLAKADKWTSNKGYVMVNRDLNAKTGEAAVYIGYLTTNKASEAITDTAIMDMDGGYSFAKYEEMLADQKEDLKAKLDNFKPMLEEYQKNYAEGKATAIYAHDLMNLFEDGDPTSKYAGEGDEKDTGEKLGDYFLEKEKKISDDKLVKLLIQSNSALMINVYYALAIGCSDSTKDNWAQRMIDNKKALSAKEYDDKAQDLMDVVSSLRTTLTVYEERKDDLPVDATEEEIDAYQKEEKLTDEEMTNILNAMQIYVMLDSYEYKYGNGTTLADFFLQSKITKKQLYRLAAALTPGQFGTAYYAGLETLIQANGATKKEFNEAMENTGATMDSFKKKIKDLNLGKEQISIYKGVDRRLFFHGVACTDAEQRAEAINNDSYNPFFGNQSLSAEIHMIASVIISGTLAVLGSIRIARLGTVMKIFGKQSSGIVARSLTGFKACFYDRIETVIPDIDVITTVRDLNDSTASDASEAVDLGTTTNSNKQIVGSSVSVEQYSFRFGWRSVVAIADCIMWAYTFTMIGIYLYKELNAYYHPTMKEKPIIMMDNGESTTKKSVAIKYDAVLEYNEAGDDVVADLNAGEAKQWNVLYVSKDTNAGTPLTADGYLYKTGSGQADKLANYTAFHYFGEEGAYNLNKHCYKGAANGIYMFFTHEDQPTKGASQTGSVFGSGNVIALFVLICIAGLAAGTVGGYAFGKKRKTNVAKEA